MTFDWLICIVSNRFVKDNLLYHIQSLHLSFLYSVRNIYWIYRSARASDYISSALPVTLNGDFVMSIYIKHCLLNSENFFGCPIDMDNRETITFSKIISFIVAVPSKRCAFLIIIRFSFLNWSLISLCIILSSTLIVSSIFRYKIVFLFDEEGPAKMI